MKTITYTCDRCGKEDATDDMQLWGVAVVTRYSSRLFSQSDVKVQGDWCRACMIETSLLGSCIDEDKQVEPIAPRPTLEDLIKDIVREVQNG